MKIEFYEPSMCCSTGLCGSNPDQRLVMLDQNINYLKYKYKHLEVHRYMISQQPAKFSANRDVLMLIRQQGRAALPVSAFNGRVFKVGDYPTLQEMEYMITNGD